MLELRTRLHRLFRQPGYAAAVVLSLGLGVAVSVAALSFTNALVFRPLPGIRDRPGLIRVDWADRNVLLTTTEFDAIELQGIPSFTTVAAQGNSSLPVMLPAGPETVSVAFVSARFFETLGTQ